MGKFSLAIALLAVSAVANAVPVVVVVHNQTSSGGTVSTLITDGSHVTGISPPSDATFDWDGTTLTSTGLYTAVSSLGSSPFSSVILSDELVDLAIDTSTGTASATSYTCVEGTFLAAVGGNGCGDYSLGPNFVDESTLTYSGTDVTLVLGGDDGPFEGATAPEPRSIAAYDFGTVEITGVDGLTPGDLVIIGNGIPVGTPGGTAITFQVVPVPAAVWLFGSALGLLGWVRRRAA